MRKNGGVKDQTFDSCFTKQHSYSTTRFLSGLAVLYKTRRTSGFLFQIVCLMTIASSKDFVFVCLDVNYSSHHSQQFFSHVRMISCLPGLNPQDKEQIHAREIYLL